MGIEWTSLPPGLALNLAPGGRIGEQIEGQLRDAIRAGRLRAGEAMPSSRGLALQLGVSRGTVTLVYGQLAAEGYLDSRPGAATRVAMNAASRVPPAAAAALPSRLTVDFLSGVPDLGSFPVNDWVRSVSEATREAGPEVFGYGDPRGDPTLRSALASYLRRVRGAAAEAESVVVCAGFAQGASLVLSVLASRGIRMLAVEDPGDVSVSEMARRSGLEVVPVAVDDEGVDVAALARSGARAVVLTPAHQSPTGVALSPRRRQAVVEWAERVDGFIIEDDYDSEFRYDRAPLGAVQGLLPSRVALVGSTSKTLAPALRLGWLVAPPALGGAIALAKRAADRGSPALDQRALARMMEAGRYDRHLRRMRGLYSRRRRALVAAVASAAPDARLSGLAGGFHAVLDLPPGSDENAVIEAARLRSVGLHGMSEHRTGRNPGAAQLVIGFGNCGAESITAGIAAVADLLGD